jgi:hypothetical protein
MKRTNNEIINLVDSDTEEQPLKKRKLIEKLDDDEKMTITLSKKHLEKLDVKDYQIVKKPYYLQTVTEEGEMIYCEINTEHKYFEKVINAFKNGRLDDDESPQYEGIFYSFITSIGRVGYCDVLEEDVKNQFTKFFDLEIFQEDDFKNLVFHHKKEDDDYLHSDCLKGRRELLENGLLILCSFF